MWNLNLCSVNDVFIHFSNTLFHLSATVYLNDQLRTVVRKKLAFLKISNRLIQFAKQQDKNHYKYTISQQSLLGNRHM